MGDTGSLALGGLIGMIAFMVHQPLTLIIVGGIYGGVFSPTEAAAVCVLYAFLLEFVVFRSLRLKDIYTIAKSTGLITAVVFILVAVGNGFSWIISFAQIPQAILAAVGVNEAGPVGVLIAICVAFFIACMFAIAFIGFFIAFIFAISSFFFLSASIFAISF